MKGRRHWRYWIRRNWEDLLVFLGLAFIAVIWIIYGWLWLVLILVLMLLIALSFYLVLFLPWTMMREPESERAARWPYRIKEYLSRFILWNSTLIGIALVYWICMQIAIKVNQWLGI